MKGGARCLTEIPFLAQNFNQFVTTLILLPNL